MAQEVIQNRTGSVYPGYSGRFQNVVNQVTDGGHPGDGPTAAIIGSKFDTILGILNSGVAGITDTIESSRNSLTSSTTVVVQNSYHK